jgi:hypothetical protein
MIKSVDACQEILRVAEFIVAVAGRCSKTVSYQFDNGIAN